MGTRKHFSCACIEICFRVTLVLNTCNKIHRNKKYILLSLCIYHDKRVVPSGKKVSIIASFALLLEDDEEQERARNKEISKRSIWTRPWLICRKTDGASHTLFQELRAKNSDCNWPQSPLKLALESNAINLPDAKPLQGRQNAVLFECTGDDAFPLFSSTMKPYPRRVYKQGTISQLPTFANAAYFGKWICPPILKISLKDLIWLEETLNKNFINWC